MVSLEGKKVQCITRIYKYIGDSVMHYIKNDSQIKILKIPWIWAEIKDAGWVGPETVPKWWRGWKLAKEAYITIDMAKI